MFFFHLCTVICEYAGLGQDLLSGQFAQLWITTIYLMDYYLASCDPFTVLFCKPSASSPVYTLRFVVKFSPETLSTHFYFPFPTSLFLYVWLGYILFAGSSICPSYNVNYYVVFCMSSAYVMRVRVF